MNIADLEPGYRLARETFTISAEQAAAYAGAVGDESPPASSPDLVPPMAVIAAGLSRVIDALSLGAGTVHAGQEVEFDRPVLIGEQIAFETRLSANRVRGEARFATLVTEFFGADGLRIARSVSTVIVPA